MTRSGGASATLRYDPLGRLYEVTGSSGTRRFLYDGSDLVAEYNTAGALLRRYVHGLGAGDDPLVWYEGSGLSDRRYLYADERGSIVAVTNGAGSALAINKYDEYGIPAAGNLGAFQYTGQVWLPELGMYHYQGPHVLAHARAVHADRSHRIRRWHEHVCLCRRRPGELGGSDGPRRVVPERQPTVPRLERWRRRRGRAATHDLFWWVRR